MLRSKVAFSLVELLVFVSILGVFFIMAASVVTISLRNMKENELKIKATHYANQLEEWLRVQKEIDWGGGICDGCSNPITFTEYASRQGSAADDFQTRYCFNSSPIDYWQDLDACPAFGLDNTFVREVTFTSTPVGSYINQINAQISVQWQETNTLRSVTYNTTFSIFEQ